MKIAFSLLLCCWIGVSAADVYRCQQDGKPIYTDKPCAAGAAPAQLPALNSAAGERGAPDLAKQYDADEKREESTRAAASREWLRAHHDDATRAEDIRRAVIDGRVVKGMTPQQVEQVLNLPLRVEGQGGPHERWIYQNGRERRTIAFKDGVVSSDTVRHGRR